MKHLVLVASSLAALAVVLEIATRLFVPDGYWRFRDATSDWQLDPEIGWVNLANLDVESRSRVGMVHYRTNADGVTPHGARRDRQPGELRIMVFGDSMVVGRDLPQDRIYTRRLEELLRERGVPAEVVNAGVQGYSTDQALLLMERLVPLYRPDVVLFGSTLNDFGGNEVSEANRQAKPRFQLERGRLRYIPPQLAERVRPYGSGPRAWVQHSAFYRVLQPRIFILRARFGGWEQRNLLGLMQEVYVDPAALEQLDWNLFGALLARMQQSTRAAGARLLVFAHPEVGEVWAPYIEKIGDGLGVARSVYDSLAVQRRVESVAALAGVEFIPVAARFLEEPSRGPFHLVPYDAHLNVAGHELLAEVLADALLARGLASPQPPSEGSARSADAPRKRME